MNIHCFQHVGYEGPACIPVWAAERGYDFTVTRTDLDSSLPALDDVDLLIVLGGPMSVYRTDRWPWIETEKAYVRDCIAAGKPVLGICLGAQLIAAAIGEIVEPNAQKEIGWFDVELRPAANKSLIAGILPRRFLVFQWHGDRYRLPAGAVSLASSEGCDEQAFQYRDNVVGLQFHLEATPEWVTSLADRDADQLVAGLYIQTREQMLQATLPFASNNAMICQILDRMADRAVGQISDDRHRESVS